MKKLLAFILAFMLYSCKPVEAVPEMGAYTAVMSSPDLAFYFKINPKYKTDRLVVLSQWEDLPIALDYVSKHSGTQPIFLDFMVHGNSDGLYVIDDAGIASEYDRASFGYVINQIKKHLSGRKIILCFESCQVAAAYKNTIRRS